MFKISMSPSPAVKHTLRHGANSFIAPKTMHRIPKVKNSDGHYLPSDISHCSPSVFSATLLCFFP